MSKIEQKSRKNNEKWVKIDPHHENMLFKTKFILNYQILVSLDIST